MSFRTAGIHHVTGIASDPQRNLDFYAGILGLRLVKRTVNFDDPTTYHFYFGDEQGNPGSILTFFPWPDARRGRQGGGQVAVTSFAILPSSVGFWIERLIKKHVEFEQPDELGGGEGVYHGPEGFARGTQQLLDVFEDFRADPEEFLDAGQHIVAYVRLSGRARDSGVPFDDPYTHLVRFRGEQIDLGHAYSDRREALKAVGLSE